jgi:hypothetical protein
VSQYEFGWWKRPEYTKHFRSIPNFQQLYPRFPNLTFEEYVRAANAAFCRYKKGRQELGLHTEEFVNFYFKNPREVAPKIDDEYLAAQRYKMDMFNIHFIRTECLNEELHAFLLSQGYQAEDIDFVLSLGKILPYGKGRDNHQAWQSYYTPELKQMVRHRERLIFTVFPEFDV